ncbi:MAG: hypothetical protein JXB48_01950 [Candidatus Latescibacteria bacterium]|nr:hypothetical protein [Candidatus Latescibacterota bacterium]
MNSLAYKKNTDDVIQRLTSLYAKQAPYQIFASFEIPNSTLMHFLETHEEGFCAFPDPNERISFWDAYYRERSDIEDDSMPCVYLSEFDQGLYGGLIGGEVQFMCHDNGWISSMVPPLLTDWAYFENLRFSKTHPWFERFIEQVRIFKEGSAGKFGISHFILIDGLNFVFELVGATNAYMSVIEKPEIVKKAIDFAFNLNVTVHREFFDQVGLFKGGTFSNFAQWIPGRIVSESVDPFHMTSTDYFEEWGRENIERMFAAFDGGVVHIHGNGRHLIEHVCSLKGLKTMLMLDDTGFPLAFDIIDQLKQRAGDIPLVVYAPFNSFFDRLKKHSLPGGVFYQVTGTPDADTANSLMDMVRDYRV